MTTTCTVTQNWDNDGMLDIHNAQTLDKYQAIRNEQYHHRHPEIVWEFSDMKKVIAKLKPLLKEDEKIINFASGGFATPKGLKLMEAYYASIDERISKECDPQEVYYYEYNNHESCINMEGDTDAIQIVLDIYGEDIARSIKRYSKCITIDQLLLKDYPKEGLWVNAEDATPHYMWFSDIDGKAFYHYNNALLHVYDATNDNKQFEAENKHWWGMTCSYKNGVLTRWRKN